MGVGMSHSRAVFVALLMLMPCLAAAAGFGRLTVLSAIGQPLVGEIELVSVTREELGSLSARLASPDAYAAANLQYNPSLTIEDGSGAAQTVRLAYPEEADAGKGRVSVLSPLGNALLGVRVGDQVSFATPVGERRVRVTGIPFQPEAAGQFDL